MSAPIFPPNRLVSELPPLFRWAQVRALLAEIPSVAFVLCMAPTFLAAFVVRAIWCGLLTGWSYGAKLLHEAD